MRAPEASQGFGIEQKEKQRDRQGGGKVGSSGIAKISKALGSGCRGLVPGIEMWTQ